MLQQVLVLEQELVHTSLGLQPCRCLCCQLVLQQVDLDRIQRVSTGRCCSRAEGSTLAVPAHLPGLTSIPTHGVMKQPFPAATAGVMGSVWVVSHQDSAHWPLASLMESSRQAGSTG